MQVASTTSLHLSKEWSVLYYYFFLLSFIEGALPSEVNSSYLYEWSQPLYDELEIQSTLKHTLDLSASVGP